MTSHGSDLNLTVTILLMSNITSAELCELMGLCQVHLPKPVWEYVDEQKLRLFTDSLSSGFKEGEDGF